MTADPDRTGHDGGGAIREALAAAMNPLDPVSPDASVDDASLADLDPVGEAVGDADVVGMGEASHGTREFFRFKHRLFRYLVAERDFRMLGLEANFAAALDVNDYVVRGDGTAEDALSGRGIHDVYQTESVLELVEWMRAFNEGRPEDDRVRFHGIDVQHPSAAAERLETYFEAVDPAVLTGVRDDVESLADGGVPDTADDDALRAHLDARQAVTSTLGDALDENETVYVDATSRTAYERACRFVWTIEQGYDLFEAIYRGRTDTGANVRIRDSAMAAQVQWLLRHESVDRMAVWGHNAHLARDSFAGGVARNEQSIPSLGRNLATLGTVDYYALGLVLGGGTVGATYVPEMEFRPYEIEDPPEGSVPDVFGRVDPDAFFLDVAGLPDDSPLAEWLDSEPRQFDVVGGYEESPVNLVELDLRAQFDGVAFFADTNPSRPLSTER